MGVARTHDATVAERLLANGGRLRRLAHDMVGDLRATTIATPQPAKGIAVQALECDPKVIAAAAARATPPDHIDFEVWSGVNRTRYWRQLLAGEGPCGAILPEPSRLIRDAEGGDIAGVVAVAAMPVSEWWPGDPWVPEIFVVPNFQGRGLGAFMLRHAMRTCAAAGHQRLGLTVSEGNPARHLYERLGFRPFRATWFIVAADEPPVM